MVYNSEKIKQLLEFPCRKSASKMLSDLKNENLIMYGAGSMGRLMLNYLKKNNVNIECFFDQNADKIDLLSGIPIFSINNYEGDLRNKTLILSIILEQNQRKELIDHLSSYGFKRIIDANNLLCYDIKFSDDYEQSSSEALKKIEVVYNLLADDKSKKIFVNNIYAHLSGDYSKCDKLEDSTINQYFPDDIDYQKDYSVFVDCGAFIGDTIERLLTEYSPNSIVAFEPFEKHYKVLLDKFNSLSNKMFYNLAVSDTAKTCRFKIDDDSAGAGHIASSGNITIKSVRMDDIISNVCPTFIKMDIEGEELKSIKGAENLISKNHPDLAICVYHNIEHIWEVPYLINSIYNGYNFYLRTYNSYTYETVLYAFK